MWSMRKKLEVPSPEQSLPGRAIRMPVPDRHYVNGHPLEGPYPPGLEQAVFGLGCFWGAERKFWEMPGVYTTAVGYAGGHTPNPTYEEACSGQTGHTEAVLVVFDPKQTSYEALLKTFWESHDPTQGCARATTSARNIAPRSTPIRRSSAAPPKRRANAFRKGWRPPATGRSPPNPRRAAILFRRGLSPAIPGEEPVRLLQARRHRGQLPGRRHRRGLNAQKSGT